MPDIERLTVAADFDPAGIEQGVERGAQAIGRFGSRISEDLRAPARSADELAQALSALQIKASAVSGRQIQVADPAQLQQARDILRGFGSDVDVVAGKMERARAIPPAPPPPPAPPLPPEADPAALRARVALLERGAQISRTAEASAAALRAIETSLDAALSQGNLALDTRIRLEETLARASTAAAQAEERAAAAVTASRTRATADPQALAPAARATSNADVFRADAAAAEAELETLRALDERLRGLHAVTDRGLTSPEDVARAQSLARALENDLHAAEGTVAQFRELANLQGRIAAQAGQARPSQQLGATLAGPVEPTVDPAALRQRVALLAEGARDAATYEASLRGLAGIERTLEQALERGNLSLDERIALSRTLSAASTALGEATTRSAAALAAAARAPQLGPAQVQDADQGALQRRVALLAQGTAAARTSAASLQELRGIEQALQSALRNGNLSLEQRIALSQTLARTQAALASSTAALSGATATASSRFGGLTTAAGGFTSIGNRFGATAVAVGFGLESLARGGAAAEGGLRTALRSVASFAAFLGPEGLVVAGVAAGADAIYEYFSRAQRAMEETTAKFYEGLNRMREASDVSGLGRAQQRLFSGFTEFDVDPKSATFGREVRREGVQQLQQQLEAARALQVVAQQTLATLREQAAARGRNLEAELALARETGRAPAVAPAEIRASRDADRAAAEVARLTALLAEQQRKYEEVAKAARAALAADVDRTRTGLQLAAQQTAESDRAAALRRDVADVQRVTERAAEAMQKFRDAAAAGGDAPSLGPLVQELRDLDAEAAKPHDVRLRAHLETTRAQVDALVTEGLGLGTLPLALPLHFDLADPAAALTPQLDAFLRQLRPLPLPIRVDDAAMSLFGERLAAAAFTVPVHLDLADPAAALVPQLNAFARQLPPIKVGVLPTNLTVPTLEVPPSVEERLEAGAKAARDIADNLATLPDSARRFVDTLAQGVASASQLSKGIEGLKGGGGLGATLTGLSNAIGGIAGLAGAVAGVVTSLTAESEAHRENRLAVEAASRALTEFKLAASGFNAESASSIDAARQASAAILNDPRLLQFLDNAQFMTITGSREAVERVSRANGGLDIGALEAIARSRGVELFDSNGRTSIDRLRAFDEAVRAAQEGLLHFTDAFDDQSQRLELADRINDRDAPADAFNRARQLLTKFDQPVGALFDGIDASTQEGVQQAKATLRDIFRQYEDGLLGIGSLDKAQFLGVLGDLDTALDRAAEAANSAADQLASLNVPAGFRVDAARFAATSLANLLTPDLRSIANRPPTDTTQPPLVLNPSVRDPALRPLDAAAAAVTTIVLNFPNGATITTAARSVAELADELADYAETRASSRFGLDAPLLAPTAYVR